MTRPTSVTTLTDLTQQERACLFWTNAEAVAAQLRTQLRRPVWREGVEIGSLVFGRRAHELSVGLPPLVPRCTCAKPAVLRCNRNNGSLFWGCPDYPQTGCGTQDAVAFWTKFSLGPTGSSHMQWWPLRAHGAFFGTGVVGTGNYPVTLAVGWLLVHLPASTRLLVAPARMEWPNGAHPSPPMMAPHEVDTFCTGKSGLGPTTPDVFPEAFGYSRLRSLPRTTIWHEGRQRWEFVDARGDYELGFSTLLHEEHLEGLEEEDHVPHVAEPKEEIMSEEKTKRRTPFLEQGKKLGGAVAEGLAMGAVDQVGETLIGMARKLLPEDNEALNALLNTPHGREVVKLLMAGVVHTGAETGGPLVPGGEYVAAAARSQIKLSTAKLAGQVFATMGTELQALASLGKQIAALPSGDEHEELELEQAAEPVAPAVRSRRAPL